MFRHNLRSRRQLMPVKSLLYCGPLMSRDGCFSGLGSTEFELLRSKSARIQSLNPVPLTHYQTSVLVQPTPRHLHALRHRWAVCQTAASIPELTASRCPQLVLLLFRVLLRLLLPRPINCIRSPSQALWLRRSGKSCPVSLDLLSHSSSV